VKKRPSILHISIKCYKKMNNLKRACLILLHFLVIGNCSAVQHQSTLLEGLKVDLQDQSLDDFSHIKTAFILSGVQKKKQLDACIQWYHQTLEILENSSLDPFKPEESAQSVFIYLHTHHLKTYSKHATTLLDIMRTQTFNCVSATILYNLLCADLGLETQAFETPTHVYTLFTQYDKRIMVENTTSMGFNIIKNLRNYSRYLARFYPENQVLKIGLDRLYFHEQSKGRQINNTELLGLLAYNQAYLAREKNQFSKAYEWVLLAQLLNEDSRSNITFEKSLYYQWGKMLVHESRFEEAFTVYADGTYRYPEMEELANNCKLAFFHSQRDFEKKDDWNSAHQMSYEILDLDILDERDIQALTVLLDGWAGRLLFEQNRKGLKEVIELLEIIDPTNPRIHLLKNQLEQ